MTPRDLADRLRQRLSGRRTRAAERAAARDRANLETVLPWALHRAGPGIAFPAAYVEFLRGCLERRCLRVTTLHRRRGGADTEPVRRFAVLLDALGELPPLDLEQAERTARIADALRRDTTPFASGHWCGDIRAHFELTSSGGPRGRLLAAIVRFMRATRCLELGTAYGMSALFLLEALSRHGPGTHLTTVESLEALHRLSAGLLEDRFAHQVRCELGPTSRVLPVLARTLGPVDFLFHDAGHSRDDYVNDFQAALPILAPGAVVLIDDIDWHDPRFTRGNPRCRAGWREVARHERVRWALEIDGSMGLALLD